MPLAIGFTGTRRGMSGKQKQVFINLLAFRHATARENYSGDFHHGDCTGADAEAHDIAASLKYWTVSHPPNVDWARAFTHADSILPPLPYLARNHAIVDGVDIMIATPHSYTEEVRSGTWATIRYCWKQGKPIYIIRPDGFLIGRTEEEAQRSLLTLSEIVAMGDPIKALDKLIES